MTTAYMPGARQSRRELLKTTILGMALAVLPFLPRDRSDDGLVVIDGWILRRDDVQAPPPRVGGER